MYFDTTYLAKYYLNEAESRPVRELVRSAGTIRSSLWALTEFHAVLHRHLREGSVTSESARDLAALFARDAEHGLWSLAPLSGSLLRRTGALILATPPNQFIRAGDAVHLATANELGEREVWTNDRHMLAAAPYFGLSGRSV